MVLKPIVSDKYTSIFSTINDLVASNNAKILGTVVIVVVVGIFLYRHAKSSKIIKVNFHNVCEKYSSNFLLIIKICVLNNPLRHI